MFNPEQLNPLGNRIIVQVLDHKTEEKTKSGIVLLPSTKTKKVLKCKIIRISDYIKSGNIIDNAPYVPDVKEGDIVYIEQAYLYRFESSDYAYGNIYDILGKEE